MKSVHFITGATGFVGAGLAIEILRRTNDDVLCLVRPGSEDVTERLHGAIMRAAECYGLSADIEDAVVERCRAIAGDVEQPGCGISAIPEYRCDHFWHSAASLRFEDRYAEEIDRTNILGTSHALDLAARFGTRYFNYISTAYVCGSSDGTVFEGPTAPDVPINNRYERSKVAAELLVANDDRFARRIMRPSIVIGHSRTRAATAFSGMYGMIRQFHAFKGMADRMQSGVLDEKSIHVLADGDTRINFVPIDRVVENAVAIAMQTRPEISEVQYYHLTNPTPPPVDVCLSALAEIIGLQPMTYASSTQEFDWIDDKINGRIGFYASYLTGQKIFDRTRAEAVVGDTGHEAYDMPESVLREYGEWYVDLLQGERAALPGTR